MSDKELLTGFMDKFRINCNYRFMSMPIDLENMDLPMHIYNDAYKETKEELSKESSLNEEEIKKIDDLYKYFINSLKETDNYNEADKKTNEYIIENQMVK